MDTANSTCDDLTQGATTKEDKDEKACTKEIGGVVFPCDPLQAGTDPNKWIQNAITIALQFAGAGAFLLSLYGGAVIMFARGEPKKVTDGKHIIVYAVIGLIVILLSYLMLNVIFSVLQKSLTTT